MKTKPQPRSRRAGRRRWAELVRYLTETMKTARSERTRMQAAMRLADLLALQEERELTEIRAAARIEAARIAAQAGQTPLPTEGEDAQTAVQTFLSKVRAGETEDGDSTDE